MKKSVVLSVGGSLINPGTIDTAFLKRLKAFIKKSGHRFIIVCGGGAPARAYANAARALGLGNEHADAVGIQATLLNAELVRHMLAASAVRQKPERVRTKITVAAGWKIGCSSDHDAVLWALANGAKDIINLSNTDYVYTKDPRKRGAKPLAKISWSEYRKLIPSKWKSGLSTPFDPVAARTAQRGKLRVACINGKKLSEAVHYLAGKKFTGTVIS